MEGLSMFFAENAIKDENIKVIASKRFMDNSGVPIEWEICCITTAEDDALRKMCMKTVPIKGKKNQYTQEIDFNLYVGKLAAKCTVYPNLESAELQNSYGVMGADTLLKTMLKPGEFMDYINKIQEINGFDTTMEELVEESKN